MITITCQLDELATYRDEIMASTQFVAYDTTVNTEIIDGRLSALTTPTISVSTATSSFFETGCVLVGIVGTNNTGVYALTPAQASSLLNRISTQWLDDADMLPVPDVSDFSNWDDAIGVFIHNVTVGIRQLIATGKAPDCLKSAIYVPVPIEKFSGSSARIWLGDYDTGITAKLLNTAGHADEVTSVNIPWQFSDWRRNAPYTLVYIKLPYLPPVAIPNGKIIGASSITVEVHVSQSGSVSYNLSANGAYISRLIADCSCGYMIGASNVNPLTNAGGIATAGMGAAALGTALATGGTAAIIGGGAATIVGVLSSITSQPESVGYSGGGAYTDSALIQCYTVNHNTNVDPSSVSAFMGTPTMAVKSLAGLSGYVECRNASVSIPSSAEVTNKINNMLNGGVYLE